jgi:PAS domain S-box-containing protein
MQLKLTHKTYLMVAIPLVLELCLLLMVAGLLSEAESAKHRQYISKQGVASANELMQLSYNSGIVVSEYATSRDPKTKERFKELEGLSRENLNTLRLLSIHNPKQASIFRKICDEWLSLIAQYNSNLDAIGKNESVVLVPMEKCKPLIRLSEQVHRYVDEEKRSNAGNPEAEAHYSELVNYFLTGGIVVNLLMAGVFTGIFNSSVNSRLKVLMDNIARLSKRQQLNIPLRGHDEIAQLDQTFHKMASELTALAARERAILENAADVIFSLNGSFEVVSINPAAVSLFQKPAQEIIGKTFFEFVSADEKSAVRAYFENCKSIPPTSPIEVRLKTASNDVEMQCSVRWSQTEDSYYCVAHNITEQKELQRIKEQFLAMVSHDLRSPLTSLQMFIQLLEKGHYGLLSDEGKFRTQEQLSENERLINLINSLLDMEKLKAGKFEIDKEESSIDQLISRAVAALSLSAQRKNVSLEWERSGIYVFVDGDRIVQVLVNLISNAIKYSPEGQPVRINIVEEEEYIEVQVVDKGIGIPEEMTASIFDKFEQIKSKERKAHGGTGLGLAISKLLIEEHGGIIGVSSTEGEGSVFWFRLYPSVVAQPQLNEANA